MGVEYRNQEREKTFGKDSSFYLLFTTDPGLESIVAEEFHKRTSRNNIDIGEGAAMPFGLLGHVLFETAYSIEELWPSVQEMRSAHHALELIRTFEFNREQPLKSIFEEVYQTPVRGMDEAKSFRITTKRTGNHNFTSMDVQREAGAAVEKKYQTKVDLENYDLNIRVDVMHNTCVAGVQLTRESLTRRYSFAWLPKVSLKTNLAYGMVHLAGLENKQGAVLDPFCGSGTLLMEAVEVFPHIEAYGSDWEEEAVEGAEANRWYIGGGDRIHIQQADARELSSVYHDKKFCAVITNPPYGLRLGRKVNYMRFYLGFLEEVAKVLESGGRLVILVWKTGHFERALKHFNNVYRLADRRWVDRGEVALRLYTLERTVNDEENG